MSSTCKYFHNYNYNDLIKVNHMIAFDDLLCLCFDSYILRQNDERVM